MKDIYEYGLMNDDEWDILPWVCYDSRPLFKIWVTSEEIAPFFIVQHHPYSISILLKINDTFKADVFQKAGLEGNSRDWERLAKKLIEKFEEENSGTNMFKFDSDEDVFCIFSAYIDDLLMFVRSYLKKVCDNEKIMIEYLINL